MVFVDTGVWFALVSKDPNHQRTTQGLDALSEQVCSGCRPVIGIGSMSANLHTVVDWDLKNFSLNAMSSRLDPA